MKNNKSPYNNNGIISKINNIKINPKQLYAKKNSKNNITPRQSNIIQNTINSNTANKIKVNILTNEDHFNNNNATNFKQRQKTRLSKSKEKIISSSGTRKKSSKKVLKVNKSFLTYAQNKNKKNEINNYNSLINSIFTSENDNKDDIKINKINSNNMNSETNSSKRIRNKSREIQQRKTIGNIKSFSDENNNNKNNNNNNMKVKNSTIACSSTTGKKPIKKTKSNSNIKINLNKNFNNLINSTNIKSNINHKINNDNNSNSNINSKNRVIKNDNTEYANFNSIKLNTTNSKNKIEKKENRVNNFNLKSNKVNVNLNKKKNNKNKEINANANSNANSNGFTDKSKKSIKIIRNDSMDIKKKKRSSKSTKKLLAKTITKKNFQNDNNKSTCTINDSKIKINVGRTSTNEMFYNSINNTNSVHLLNQFKHKPKQNINKKKNSINLLGSYNVKKTNTIAFKNNNIVNSNNLKKKNSTIFQDKKTLSNNQNKKNKKIISNNIDTNNTTGTIGTILMNKDEQSISKVLDSKKNKNKSSQYLKCNQVGNITDSIETRNISNYDFNNYNNNINVINNQKGSNFNLNIKISNVENDEIIGDNLNNENNESLFKKPDKYYQLLKDSPNTLSSGNHQKIEVMSKKNKSVSHLHIVKKEENVEGLKKCPLSKKSFRPKLSDKIIIKFEDLLTFETKLDDIVTALSNKDTVNEDGASNECAEFMAFYFHSSLFGIFSNFFNPNNKIIIHSGNNLLLLSIIITYHLSINPKMLTNLLDDMKYIFSLIKINYLLLIKKIEIYYDDEFPEKYIDIFNQKLGQIKITNCSNEIDIISKINKNCCNITERMKLILNSYQRNNDKNYNEFNGIFKNISTVSEKNINNYFYSYIYINPFNFESNKINNITNINNNYNNICGSSKNFSRMSSSISSGSNTSIKGFDDNDSDNFYNDNMSYKTEKSEDGDRELSSIKSYKSINYCGKIKSNNEGSTINCDNNFYYNIENNIYENDEDGTNAYEIMRMIKEYEINKVDAPFIVSQPKKKYTLVLDLDETLIHLRPKKEVVNVKNDINIKINNASECFYENYDKDRNKYLLQFRVGLFSFLTILKPFYEIISFTSATREYSDAIINEIEKNKTFFDYKFYREHTVIYKDTFVKDISRIGRDIKKMIIIDNNEKNFILNKENGIKIAPYYGDEDNNHNINNSIHSENNGRLSYGRKKGNDNVLLELKKILVMMYKDNYDDLREALKDYEDLIKAKVSMSS